MLRFLFDEPPRREDGSFHELLQLIHQYRERVTPSAPQRNDRRLRLAVWTKSIEATLDELEQSVYCSQRFATLVQHSFVDQMGEQERLHYQRHLYFFENSFVRIFSALDKLGCFLNDLFSLRTEEVKERFSYFTVIRRLRERNVHSDLQHELYKLKEKFREPMNELRLMRNHEVHGMNSELLDENGRIRRRTLEGHEQIENLKENSLKLQEGFTMVCESMRAVFTYCNRNM